MQPLSSSQHSGILMDGHGRRISYLRLAVTDRCNLHCTYCRPEKCAPHPRGELLSYEELHRLVRIFAGLGIRKVRITGGEPFARQGLVGFIERIMALPGIETVALTTNGTLALSHIRSLKQLGIAGINFSLDTLSPARYQNITGAALFHAAFAAILEAIIQSVPTKINTVVLDNQNTDELLDLAKIAEHHPVAVRFIEPMPFGLNTTFAVSSWTAARLKEFFLHRLPGSMELLPTEGSTAHVLKVKNFQGTIGIIGGHTRIFCASCNKVRITPQGILKNCLYDDGVLDLRQMLRNGEKDEAIRYAIRCAVMQRRRDGRMAEQERCVDAARSMAAIGG